MLWSGGLKLLLQRAQSFSLSEQAPGASRDLLMLDLALESWFRLLIERTDLPSLKVSWLEAQAACCHSV